MRSNRHIGAVVCSVFVLALGFHVQPSLGDESDLSAEQLLAKAIGATAWTQCMHVRFEFQTGPIGGAKGESGQSPLILEQSGTGEIYVSGQRLRTIRQNAPANGFNGAHVDTLVVPGLRIMWVKSSLVQYSQSKSIIEQYASLDRALRLLGWFLDGVWSDQIYHPLTFATALRVGRVHPGVSTDEVDGIPCQVVEVDGDSWELRVWVAPLRGYNFVRYIFDSNPDPKTGRKEFHCDIEKIQYQQLANGTWVIKGGTFLNTAPDGHGGVHGDQTTVSRTLIDPAPDFATLKAFDLPPIPDGEHVVPREADENGKEIDVGSGVKYVWKDGKVQTAPDYDPQLIERLNKAIEDDSRNAATQPTQ